MSAAVPADALLRQTAAFLRRFPPFDRMEDTALQFAVSRLSLAYFPRGTQILVPGRGVPEVLRVIQKGAVSLAQPADAAAGGSAAVTLGPGECFSVGALLERRPVTNPYTAAEDTFCYELPAAAFDELCGRSARFHAFCTDYLTALLRESRRQLRARANDEAGEQQSLMAPLSSLANPDPVACTPDTPAAEALRLMSERKIGAMIVADAARSPVGIFTRSDLLDRVVLARLPLERPISDVMSSAPACLPRDASGHDAALLMAQLGIRHVIVTDVPGGRLSGIISERDLFAVQRVTLQRIHARITGARDLPALRAAAADVRVLVANLVAQGVAAEPLTQLVSALNDHLTARILGLERARHDLDGVRWCWLAFGSEGRSEQTLATDQDNGIVFAADDVEPARTRLTAFGHAVNATLDACGFPLCKGNIMAGNPELCRTLPEWQARFATWVRNPDPVALLNASIFFDCRGLYGDTALAGALRAHLRELTVNNERFLHSMTANALRTAPPLGLIRDFNTDDEGAWPGTLDLKAGGARVIADVARIWALASGTDVTATATRLREAGPRRRVPEPEIAAAVEAFGFLQLLRLRGQQTDPQGPGGHNRVDPDSLNEVDRRILKEVLRQARRLQTRLALDFGA